MESFDKPVQIIGFMILVIYNGVLQFCSSNSMDYEKEY